MPSARWWLQNLTRVRELTLERQADGTAATTVALRRALSVERLVYLSPSVRIEYFLSGMAVLSCMLMDAYVPEALVTAILAAREEDT